MDFALTDEQVALGEAVTRFANRHQNTDDRTWPRLASELGLGTLLLDSSRGGQGGGAVEMMVVMEALGQSLLSSPFVESSVMASALLNAVGGPVADGILPALATGTARAAPAWFEEDGRYSPALVTTQATRNASGWSLSGRKSVVTAGPGASHMLVTARVTGSARDRTGISLFLVPIDAAGLRHHDYPTIDGREAFDLVLENVAVGEDALVGPEGAALSLVEDANDRATVALCAEAVGIMKRAHSETLEYARQRRQFGQAIADFQVIQHRLVDMYIAIEQAVSAVYLAILKLDEDEVQRVRAVSTAKATVNRSARFVGQNAIQLHGGMGMVDELLVGRLFKRLTAIENSFGTTAWHLARHSAAAA